MCKCRLVVQPQWVSEADQPLVWDSRLDYLIEKEDVRLPAGNKEYGHDMGWSHSENRGHKSAHE